MPVRWDDGVLVLQDEVDLNDAADMRRAIDDANRQDMGRLVVDAHLCTFIDSTTIGCLVHARKIGLEVIVRRPPPVVMRVLEMSGLPGAVIKIDDT